MRHFDISEFDSPDEPGSGNKMKQKFLDMIDEAREIAGIIFNINSGYRTVLCNVEAGGKPDSSHRTGWAADIDCDDSRSRAIMFNALVAAGFNRIGISKGFLHADCDPSKDPIVYWVY